MWENRANMKITIGAKISLLTTLLVLITTWFVSSWVLDKSVQHIIDHEVVDLKDETELSAQRMLQSTTNFRQDFWKLANTIPDTRSAAALLINESPESREDVLRGWRKTARELLASSGDLVQVEIWTVGPDGKPRAAEPVARERKSTVQSVSEPTTQAELLRAICQNADPILRMSEFGQAEIIYQSRFGPAPCGSGTAGRREKADAAIRRDRASRTPQGGQGRPVAGDGGHMAFPHAGFGFEPR